jgi:RNA polymerase sigma-70 factor (ECF subfamily)
MEGASTDTELLTRYGRGDVTALEELVQRYKRPLFGFIGKMTTGSAEDPDDLFQEVWLRALKNLHTYRDGNLLGWLVRIARNVMIDRVRRRKPSTSLDEPMGEGQTLAEVLPSAQPDPRALAGQGDVGRRIEQAVDTLPPDQREVFLMRVQTDLSFKEIAAIQQVSINTALARMQYALAKLRPLLTEDYGNLRV